MKKILCFAIWISLVLVLVKAENKQITFNELKEIAKKIAMDDDRVEKLYIEQLETQSMSSDVNFFNILY